MNLDTKITALNRVGKVLETRLRHLGVETVRDLLFYFPFRYEDYSQVTPIKDLKDGEQTTILGKIELIASKRSPRKRKIITEAVVADQTDRLRVVWFGQPYITKLLKAGDAVYLSGKISSDMFGLQMKSPAYERSKPSSRAQAEGEQGARSKEQNLNNTHTARIVPMYSLTQGVTQKQLRFLMSQVVEQADNLDEWLPEEILDKADLITLPFAVKAIHFPETLDELKVAERRLKFDELFVLQLRAEMIRRAIKSAVAPIIELKVDKTKEFVGGLPFELTSDQRVAAWEILRDLQKSEPMNRLLEGDVGSGKTVVAGIAAYNVFLNGLQTVVMAPTEILARQHYQTLTKMFGKEVTIALVTSSDKKISGDKIDPSADKSKAKLSQTISNYLKLSPEKGGISIVVGTHALLSEKMQFYNLGLIVVDEQHRFGVAQRKTIKDKSTNKKTVPHFLSMTATPIPRSFALTLYGDLDLSVIKSMPKGRKEIKTRVVEEHNRPKAYEFIKAQIKAGRQAFVICPLIESDNSEKKTVMREYEKLDKIIFPNLKIGFLHGRLKSEEKEKIMQEFVAGRIDILVSTSVVEVGVDIPNASVMMIEGAERFGLAQLHQFRGRVGRSEHQSYCFLFTDSIGDKSRERLEFFEKNTDGFKVAEFDLQARGPGEVYGLAQSGMMQLRLATMRDYELIKLARDIAKEVDFSATPQLKAKVEDWENKIHLE